MAYGYKTKVILFNEYSQHRQTEYSYAKHVIVARDSNYWLVNDNQLLNSGANLHWSLSGFAYTVPQYLRVLNRFLFQSHAFVYLY
ncbi:hypothetical protein M0804_002122 [Polistes exclamans]|nr:hypothetical protein M0804_002122 [Polistes exclamans]